MVKLRVVVVPDADHAMTEGARCIFALLVCGAFTVLAAVEFDSQLSQPGILT
jgi:hypothetical protein